MKKIVLTGPESSGKTTLAKQLAEHYDTIWVPEYARTYLKNLHRSQNYNQADILEIAKGQLQLEEEMAAQVASDGLLICDTSFLVLKVWSEYKFSSCDPWIMQQVENRVYDHFFLCSIDIPWEADPLRENPTERKVLYFIYQKELRRLGKAFTELEGDKKQRLQRSIYIIDQLNKHDL